jgi:riboflavin kinase/FMN adenylyltransferase
LKVYYSLQEFKKLKSAVVTTGTFDGLHIGHRKILQSLSNTANEINAETVLITFHPHPRLVLFPDDNELKLLSTLQEKIELLRGLGLQHLLIIPFDLHFSRTTSLEFVRDILINTIGTKKLVIGYDHHFGRNREGNLDSLKELTSLYDFEVHEIPAQDINQISVSSSKIRKALSEGDVSTAAEFLNYPYHITGIVIQGRKLGRTIGFPTANIEVNDKHKLIPADGVYAVRVMVKNKYFKGMMNIGNRPTVDGKSRTIEVNIFDFDESIYDENIQISFIQRIREEKKFEGIDALKSQLMVDRAEAMKILA